MLIYDKHVPLFLTKYRPTLSIVKLQYASAASPKLFSLIHNLTSNFTWSWTKFIFDSVAFLADCDVFNAWKIVNAAHDDRKLNKVKFRFTL